MANPFSLSTVALTALLMGLAGAATGYLVGHDQGAASVQAKDDADARKTLSEMLKGYADLVLAGNAASNAMRQALAARKTQDAKSTQELKDVLAKTAGDRTDCRFDADVMRQLELARQRAANAASGGIRGAVSGTGGGH